MIRYIATILFLAVIWLGTLSAGLAQKPPSAEPGDSRLEQHLLQLNQTFADAVEKSDGAVLERLYSDEYAGVGFSGQPTTKAGMVASNNTASAALLQYDETQVKVRIHADAAVITSQAT